MENEELKQLKPGDEIFIRARYKKTYADGDVCFSLSVTSVFGEVAKGEGHTLPGNVIRPSEVKPAPKYDPCRRFREGDEAKVTTVKGRHFNCLAEDFEGVTVVVTSDEEPNSNIYVRHNEDEFTIDPAYLELVTPVEEMEPWTLDEDDPLSGVLHELEGTLSCFREIISQKQPPKPSATA